MTTLARPTIYGLFCACVNCRMTRPGEIRYVGQTIQSADIRLREHRKNARSQRDNYPVYRWIVKHGPENIRTFVLDYPDDNLNSAEAYWMSELGTYGIGPGVNASPPPLIGAIYPRSRGAQFTDDEVRDIKIRIWNGESAVSIADSLGTPNSAIFQIKSGRSYRDVPWPIGPSQKSSGREDHRKKLQGRKHSTERAAKFKVFLESWEANPFKGEQPVQWNRKSKLSRTKYHIRDFRRIRNLSRDGLSYNEIADQMPEYVTRSEVSRIVRGERWSWLD